MRALPKSTVARAVAAAVACQGALATDAAAQVLSRFEVRETVVSPDGDGKQDSTRVRFALADTALTVSIVVFEADSVTPVDTLRAPAFAVPPALNDVYWRGDRWNGTPAPEGAYVVTLRANGKTDPDTSVSLPVFVDVTPPSVQILSVIPDPYAPGVPGRPTALSVSFLVADASPVYPGRVIDELKREFFNPSGAAITPSNFTVAPPYAGSDGSYVATWDASGETSLPDGEYRVTLSLIDAAGYTAASTYHFDIDNRPPDVRATSLRENARIASVPDSLSGYAFDRNGVDSLVVRYAPNRPYAPVVGTSLRNDTLFFSTPLADSVAGEKTHSLEFRAVDGAGRTLAYTFSFTLDLTAPAAPTLDPFSGASHVHLYRLTGGFDNGGDVATLVRIYRNGAVIDSLATALVDTIDTDVPLLRGRNVFVATLADGAKNESPPSNPVTVTFDPSSGLFIPVPFKKNEAFQVNATETARSASLRVYDLTGDLVVALEDASAKRFYAFAWDGRNGSGLVAKRGPLVAVATVELDAGGRDVYREVFLFDPDR